MGSAVGLFAFYGIRKHIVDYKHLREANLVRSEIGIKGDTEAYLSAKTISHNILCLDGTLSGRSRRPSDRFSGSKIWRGSVYLFRGRGKHFLCLLPHSLKLVSNYEWNSNYYRRKKRISINIL
jgi:hypothetical protein